MYQKVEVKLHKIEESAELYIIQMEVGGTRLMLNLAIILSTLLCIFTPNESSLILTILLANLILIEIRHHTES